MPPKGFPYLVLYIRITIVQVCLKLNSLQYNTSIKIVFFGVAPRKSM